MGPTLPDGCSIQFDRNQRVWREHAIYVVRPNRGQVAKRTARLR